MVAQLDTLDAEQRLEVVDGRSNAGGERPAEVLLVIAFGYQSEARNHCCTLTNQNVRTYRYDESRKRGCP